MALPASGQISMGDVNVELGLARATANTALGQASFRTLSGVAAGQIRLGADFYGKSSFSYTAANETVTKAVGAPASGTGSGRYVKATLASGSTPTGTFGSWLQISTAPEWDLVAASGTGAKTCSITMQFSNDQSTVLKTVTITLNAESAP